MYVCNDGIKNRSSRFKFSLFSCPRFVHLHFILLIELRTYKQFTSGVLLAIVFVVPDFD